MKNINKLGTFLLCLFISLKAFSQYSGHGSESVSQEVLKKYAPAALNPDMANKLKKIFDVTSPGMGMLSPDKKTLYFTWRVTGISQVWKIDGPKSFPVQLTSGQDAVTLRDVSADGKFLILSKDLNGQENPGLFRLDLKTGLIDELYRKSKVQAGFAFLTDDSKYMFYSANDRSPESYSTYKMELSTKKTELVFEGKGNWYVADYKNNGKKILMVKYLGNKQNEYFELNVDSKELKPVIGQNEKEEYEVAFSNKDDEYIVISNKLSDFKQLYLLKDSKLKALTENLNYDVSGFSLGHTRKRILYTINKDGYTELRALDAKSFKQIKLPKLPLASGVTADHVFAGGSTRDDKVQMLGIVTAKSPRLSYSYNWDTQKLTQWVLSSAPEVDLNAFAESHLLHYVTRDKTKIPMFVRFPKNCEPKNKSRSNCPVVVHFHGGPEAQSEAGFNTLAQAFVNEGFIFVEPNVRGSDGYGKKWIDMDNGVNRENVITDIEDAAIWIKENWKEASGKPPQVGVMGWSYGGYSTLLAMTRFAGAYEAGVALVGMSNLVSFLNNTAPYRRILRISEYGDPEKDKEALLKLSAVSYVDKVKSPLMIIQGANDPRVPVGEALQIHETLTKKKIPSELIIFADEGHGSAKKENQVLEIGHMIEFFKKHLQ